jgi:23S rRNA pseudouridine1911/1915/1917 synthase
MSPRNRSSYIQYSQSKSAEEENTIPENDQQIIEVFEVRIGPRSKPERADLFLSRQIKFISRAKIQHMIRDGLVVVNDVVIIKSSHLLIPGDGVKASIPRKPRPLVCAEDIPLDIMYEDDDLLVINKAAGMVVHPAKGNFSGTLVNALMHYLIDLPEQAGVDFRPGIVHRLDRDTTGLMVVAKRAEIVPLLSKMFFERSIQRIYQALVWTCPRKLQGTIEGDIGRDPRDRLKMSVVLSGRGKSAVTHYKTIARFDFLSLLEVKLETGRTHQIRVHLQKIGHPVFGDQNYDGRDETRAGYTGDRVLRARRYLQNVNRQALHSWRMGFVHPVSGKRMEFEAPIATDIAAILEYEKELGSRLPDTSKTSVWQWADTHPNI